MDYHSFVHTLGPNAWLSVSNDCDMARGLVIWEVYLRDLLALEGKEIVTRKSLGRNTGIIPIGKKVSDRCFPLFNRYTSYMWLTK